MSINSSEFTVIPERFRGLQVLLIEDDITLQEQLARILRQNSYQVTTTTEASAGLCMIMNGCIYNGVLINADTSNADIATFLHKVFKHSPQLSIILMVSIDNYWRLPSEAIRNQAVLCLQKPCSLTVICNIWKHICRRRITIQKSVSDGEVNNTNQVNYNNVPTGNGTAHQDPDNNSQECAAKYETITYKDIFLNDDSDDDQEQVDEIPVQDKIGSGMTEKGDKGKKPVEHEKPGNKPTRLTWTDELCSKFLEAVNALGNKKAHASEILKIMNVPGLTRTHVASYLLKHRDRLKSYEQFQARMLAHGKRSDVLHGKRSDVLQLGNNVCKRSRYFTPFDNVATMNQSSSSLLIPSNRLSSTGIFYNITKSTPLSLSQLTTTTKSNFSNNHNFGGPFRPLMGSFGLVNNSNSSGHDYRNAIATEPRVAGCGSVEGSSNRGQENLFPKFPVLSAPLSNDNSKFSSSVSFGGVTTGFCGPIFPVEENNSDPQPQRQPQPPVNFTVVPLDSSQGEFVDNDSIQNMSQFEPPLNSTIVLLDSSHDDFIDDDLIPNLMSQYEPPVPYILPQDSLQGEHI